MRIWDFGLGLLGVGFRVLLVGEEGEGFRGQEAEGVTRVQGEG